MTKKKEKTLEELRAEIEKSEKRLHYYDQQEKILRKKVIPQLTRSARTNRLCTRAGMLESFLGHGTSEGRVPADRSERGIEKDD